MNKKQPSTKDEIYWKTLNCALDLEVKKGHLKWTLSELSRQSGVTRSLIYYYFGRSRMEILEHAVLMMGQDLIGLSEDRTQMWKERRWADSLNAARRASENAPNICIFYLSHRGKSNPISHKLQDLEKSFYQRIQQVSPELSREMCNTLFALYFGITFAPNVGPREIHCFAKMINNLLL